MVALDEVPYSPYANFRTVPAANSNIWMNWSAENGGSGTAAASLADTANLELNPETHNLYNSVWNTVLVFGKSHGMNHDRAWLSSACYRDHSSTRSVRYQHIPEGRIRGRATALWLMTCRSAASIKLSAHPYGISA